MKRMAVKVKLIGAFRTAAGADRLTVAYREDLSVRELMKEITTQAPALKPSLFNQQMEGQGLNALILVNSKEISALNGLQTKLTDGDEIVIVPVVHGG